MCVCLAVNHIKTTELIGWFLYRDGQSIRMKHGRIPVLIFYSVSRWGPYSVITTQFSERFNPWYMENGIGPSSECSLNFEWWSSMRVLLTITLNCGLYLVFTSVLNYLVYNVRSETHIFSVLVVKTLRLHFYKSWLSSWPSLLCTFTNHTTIVLVS